MYFLVASELYLQLANTRDSHLVPENGLEPRKEVNIKWPWQLHTYLSKNFSQRSWSLMFLALANVAVFLDISVNVLLMSRQDDEGKQN
jgi:CHASE1-domain containing sensor protein